MPEKRIAVAGFEAEDACKDAQEKSAWKSSTGDDDAKDAREVAEAKEEGDHGEEIGDVEEAAGGENEQHAKSSSEQTRPLPFVDETAEEEEEED